MMDDRKCGTCAAYGVNFYPDALKDSTCVADAFMDMPSSWSHRRMKESDGQDCPIYVKYLQETNDV